MARPVWSGPRLKRKVARAPSRSSSAASRGTPSRVPRKVSTSTLRAMSATAAASSPVRRAGRGPGGGGGEHPRKTHESGTAPHAEQLPHPAAAAGGIQPPVDPEQPRAGPRRRAVAHAGAVDLPTLAAHLGERSGERRRDRTHQVVNLPSGARPVDAAVLRRPPAEILAREDPLRAARRGTGD